MKLRKVCLEDKDLILDWRNRKEVRTFMYTSREISSQEHANWFGKMICDKTKCWTILEHLNKSIAIIYFYDIDQFNHKCSWGFYPAPISPRGISVIIEKEALNYAFLELNLNSLNCEVLESNNQVFNLHKKAGFNEINTKVEFKKTDRGIEKIIKLKLSKKEWEIKKNFLEVRADKVLKKITI